MNHNLIRAFMLAVINMLLTIMHNTCPKDERFDRSNKSVDAFFKAFE